MKFENHLNFNYSRDISRIHLVKVKTSGAHLADSDLRFLGCGNSLDLETACGGQVFGPERPVLAARPAWVNPPRRR